MSLALTSKAVPLPPPPRLLDRHRGVSFHEERFSWLRYEAEHLFADHYREASADLSLPLQINWPIFSRLEEVDLEVCVVARINGFPIGYAVYVLVPHLHYDQRVADADVFFVDRRFRSGWIGVRLFQVAERLLRERGVNEIWSRVKLHVTAGQRRRDLGGLFRWLGYRPVETIYRKRLS